MQGRAWGNEYRTTIVCVDEYQDSILSGRLYHPCLSEGDSFRSLMEFFRKMEDLLDGMQFPQSFTAVEVFLIRRCEPAVRREQTCGKDDVQRLQSGCCSGKMPVGKGQFPGWKGSREESFRSALELAFLMDSALMTKVSLPADNGPTFQSKESNGEDGGEN